MTLPVPNSPAIGRGSVDFYRLLPAVTSFSDATDIRNYVEIPDDWMVVVTDVIGSTKAIEEGAYKNVNTVGVASIAAVSNVDKSIELPYVFGGDGATFAIPRSLIPGVRKALLGARRLAREGFGLDLRLGMVAAADLRKDGHWVRIAKVHMSSSIVQPALAGRGWEEAERRVKDPVLGVTYGITEMPGEGDDGADFTGFECRWQGVASFRGHKLALLVLATSPSADVNMGTYKETLEKLHTIYGNVEDFHPLRSEMMRLTLAVGGVAPEAKVRTLGQGLWAKWIYSGKALLMNLYGMIAFKNKIDTKFMKGSTYQQEVVENSDFRKFDGMLRMVIDGDDQQFDALRDFFDGKRKEGRLVYGMHKSREALVTCIVESYNGNHTHFVDGSDGGYAIAARQLKLQIKERGGRE